MIKKQFTIKGPKGEITIGEKSTFIIAELSGNHRQNYQTAKKLIDAAAEAGADAIKLQTYTPDTITIDCDKEPFQVKVNDAWKGQTLYSLYQKAYTPWEWQPKLKKYAESKGLICFSTPFDVTAVDFLEKMDVALYKVASFEVVDIPLLKRIGQTKKPVIMSRGMSSLEELRLAVKTLKDNGCKIWIKYFENVEEIYQLSDCYIFPTTDKSCAIKRYVKSNSSLSFESNFNI